jgi:1-acyl-sn-glycerol-3-phosphate acyltransferase
MAKALSYVLSIFYWLTFYVFLLIFHPIQMLALKFGGYKAHKKSVEYLNWCLLGCLRIIGSKVVFRNTHQIPKGVPIIFVSNHQSMNDIPPFVWFLRDYHPKFVSKIELGKGIPSVSYNLRHGGSVLINRKDAKQSLRALMDFGRSIQANNYGAVIFPEGTRSKNGTPKRFSENGLKMLVKTAPSAYMVPVTINNSWKLQRYGSYPMGLGVTVTFDVHEPIAVNEYPFEVLFEKVEKAVVSGITN